jgi:hypothetical protein
VEPIVTAAALDVAAGQIGKLLEQAQARKTEDVARTLEFVRAAKEAVWSLEQECDAILTDAALCDLGDADQLRALLERIERYLHEDRIRPHLITAVTGLEGTRDQLAKRADSIRQWPWKAGDTRAAVEELERAIAALVGYLESLHGQLEYLGAGTGPQAGRIGRIKQLASQVRDGHLKPAAAHRAIDEVVFEARLDPAKGGWLEFTRSLEETSNTIRSAFR